MIGGIHYWEDFERYPVNDDRVRLRCKFIDIRRKFIDKGVGNSQNQSIGYSHNKQEQIVDD